MLSELNISKKGTERMNDLMTLGPWEAVEFDNTKAVPTYTLLARTARGSPVYVAEADRRADAKLTAAAPDLLVACRLALEVIRRHDQGDTGCPVRADTALTGYCGEDCLTDPDGGDGIADVLVKVIAHAEVDA